MRRPVRIGWWVGRRQDSLAAVIQHYPRAVFLAATQEPVYTSAGRSNPADLLHECRPTPAIVDGIKRGHGDAQPGPEQASSLSWLGFDHHLGLSTEIRLSAKSIYF
jgi:hypothetical protein